MCEKERVIDINMLKVKTSITQGFDANTANAKIHSIERMVKVYCLSYFVIIVIISQMLNVHYYIISSLHFISRRTSYIKLVEVVRKCFLCFLVLSSCCVCHHVVYRYRFWCLCSRLCMVFVYYLLMYAFMLLCRTVCLRFL